MQDGVGDKGFTCYHRYDKKYITFTTALVQEVLGLEVADKPSDS
jgi:hypothetical protein